MRRLVLFVCLVAGSAAGATEVYRWVDDSGQVHYSDLPQEGAERVQLGDAQTFSAPPVRTRSSKAGADDGADAATAAPTRYRSLEFVKPGQEEVLWNIEGRLDVSMRLEPRLQTGDRVSLFLDGQPVEGLPPDSLQARLNGVTRGVHVLRAEVRSKAGQVLIKSQPRSFAVQQTSVLNPNNPANAPIPTPRISR
jgi:hypothetical protein